MLLRKLCQNNMAATLFMSPHNKHSDACNDLPPYKLDVLKIVEYRFSCEMEAHDDCKSDNKQEAL